MPGLYGPAAGVQAAFGDAQGLARLALFPYQEQMVKAQAGLATEQLKEKQAEESAMKQWATGAGTAKPGEDASARLMRLANLEFKAGAPDAGMKIMKEADTMLLHESTIRKNAAETTRAQLQNEKLKADWVAGALRNFDPNSPDAPKLFRQVNLEYEQKFGEPSPYTDVPYSRALYKRIEQGALQYKTILAEQDKKAQQQERKRHDHAMENASKIRADAAKERAAAARAREARLAKLGGHAAGSPTSGEIGQARRLIAKEYPGLKGMETAAYDIAAQAREMTRNNPAISAGQAITRAFLQAKANGEFEPGAPPTILNHHVPFMHGTPRYDSPDNALSVTDASELKGKNNIWYSSPKGTYYLHDGKAYTLAEWEKLHASWGK